MGEFINRESHARFINQYQPLVEELEGIVGFYNEFEKEAVGDTLELHPKVILFLMSIIWDDFMEIILLFANDYPFGARKILRSMFESAVHLIHFANSPKDIDCWVEFIWIDESKLVELDSNFYEPEEAKEIKKRGADARAKFQIPACDRCRIEACSDCKKTRTAPSWMGKKDIVSLAKENQIPADIIRYGYYLSLHEAHPKFYSVLNRQHNFDDGSIGYRHCIDSDPNDRT